MPFIDLITAEREKPFYRFTDFGKLVQMFQKKEMVFVRPEKWDDPFENYIIDPEFRFADGSFLKLTYRHVIHGCCWTKKSVSDAMWRIYSPDKISVRIKSTPALVAEELEKALKKYPRSSWHIGKVQYLSQKKILNKARSLAETIYSSTEEKETAAAKSILIKRNSFAHEQEIRVLIIDRHLKSKNGTIKLKIDPHKIIQSVLVDSRAPDEWLQVYSHFLKNNIGFKGSVNKSVLYKPPDRLVINK